MNLSAKLKSIFTILLFVSCFNITMAQIESSVYYQKPNGIYEPYYNGKRIFLVDGFNLGDCPPSKEQFCDSAANHFPKVLYDFYYESLLKQIAEGPTDEIRSFNTIGNDSLKANIRYFYTKKSNDGFCRVNDSLSLVIPTDSIRNVSYYINDVLVKDSFEVARLMNLSKDEVETFHYDKNINSISIRTSKK
jgi:hypothetical protein